jgi:hypothetical protein
MARTYPLPKGLFVFATASACARPIASAFATATRSSKVLLRPILDQAARASAIVSVLSVTTRVLEAPAALALRR